MSKTSRELALMRASLSPLGPPGPTEAKLRLVTFEQTDGDNISVNPETVQSVEEIASNRSRIVLRDGTSHVVAGSHDTVIEQLQE